MLKSQNERSASNPIGVATVWAICSLFAGVIGTAIAISVISKQTSSCVDDVYSTCPPYVHNYLAAYLISGVTSAIFTAAVLFIIIAKAVEAGIRASR